MACRTKLRTDRGTQTRLAGCDGAQQMHKRDICAELLLSYLELITAFKPLSITACERREVACHSKSPAKQIRNSGKINAASNLPRVWKRCESIQIDYEAGVAIPDLAADALRTSLVFCVHFCLLMLSQD